MNPSIIIGVDECGMGSIAGSLVVGAAAFQIDAPVVTTVYRGIGKDKLLAATDSKTIKKPEHLLALRTAILLNAAATATVTRSVEEIDTHLISNTLPGAIRTAISRVMERLLPSYPNPQSYIVYLDGDLDVPPNIPCTVRPIPHGDALHWQIGAASILAKYALDLEMVALAEQYPNYDFGKNKGYPTPDHKKRLKEFGECDAHRKTFRPVQAVRPIPKGIES